MKTIHVLSPGFTNPNSSAFLFPLIAFKNVLRDYGFSIKIFMRPTKALTDCDVLLIEHKALSKNWHAEKSIEQINSYRQKTKVFWCDQSDSTGTFFGQVLPYVDAYLKAQILTELGGYTRRWYGDRVYSDFYHHSHNINDDISYDYAPARPEDLSKINLSWNSGMMNHGIWGPYLNKIRQIFPVLCDAFYTNALKTATSKRDLDLSCRMGINYPRATIRFQRERLQEMLKDKMPTDKISRSGYFNELKSCKLCLSPFGYGEITLKDFEVFLTGGALVKPDLDHLKTWPNFYQKDQTYIAFDWSLDNLEDVLGHYLKDEEKRTEIADFGQKNFIHYTAGKDAPALFAAHFSSILSLSTLS